jgi:hypothetical protein
MFSCKQVSHLVSESLDRKLPFWTCMQLWMHLGMCGLCFRFRKTMVRVDNEVRQHADEVENTSTDSDAKLSDEARDRIRAALKNS